MDSVGLLAVAAVLVIGIAVGLWRRRTDGRMRPIRAESENDLMAGSAAGQRLDPEVLAALGVAPAEATLLQFSSAFCAPCRAVRRISAEVAAMLPGVQHIEVDAESHLDEVRALEIWRTPTLLVLDAHGRVTKRATGVPSKPQLIAALGDVLPATH
jgi:thiol-disulfide isomerase/thioredoxin